MLIETYWIFGTFIIMFVIVIVWIAMLMSRNDLEETVGSMQLSIRRNKHDITELKRRLDVLEGKSVDARHGRTQS